MKSFPAVEFIKLYTSCNLSFYHVKKFLNIAQRWRHHLKNTFNEKCISIILFVVVFHSYRKILCEGYFKKIPCIFKYCMYRIRLRGSKESLSWHHASLAWHITLSMVINIWSLSKCLMVDHSLYLHYLITISKCLILNQSL